MNGSHETSDHARQDPQAPTSEQEPAGNSGEGAASALAHLKTQTRQHRRQLGDHDTPATAPRS